MRKKKKIISCLIYSMIFATSCSQQISQDNGAKVKGSLFNRMNCQAFTELELSQRQKQRLKRGTKKLFGTQEDLPNFCYLTNNNNDAFSLIKGFNFSAHRTTVYFILNKNENDLYVLQSENKSLSIIDSYDGYMNQWTYQIPEESLAEMRNVILQLMND